MRRVAENTHPSVVHASVRTLVTLSRQQPWPLPVYLPRSCAAVLVPAKANRSPGRPRGVNCVKFTDTMVPGALVMVTEHL